MLDSRRVRRYRSDMTTLTLTLDPHTADWLNREAVAAGAAPTDVVVQLLRELADPDRLEDALIDQLLAAAAHSFPPVMERSPLGNAGGPVERFRLTVAYRTRYQL